MIQMWNKSRRKLHYTIELVLPAKNTKYCYVLRNDFDLLKTYVWLYYKILHRCTSKYLYIDYGLPKRSR